MFDAPCKNASPCGPRAMAFDVGGALWVAILGCVVKLVPEALASSGEHAHPHRTLSSSARRTHRVVIPRRARSSARHGPARDEAISLDAATADRRSVAV
ncbi:hypothetical protein [Sorangium sp. So ce1182]|uniref:hypothetical protein n=1 Tax=Sorangium sp. So ce1182 TaxID=3133334 RepID=UPI003F6073FD